MTGPEIPPYAGTDCSGCGKFADECWSELQGETCCVACMDPEYNGHHMEGLDRASGERTPGRCNLCDEDMPSPYGPQEILDHIRNVHPEHYDEPERWPDGGIVIYEGNLDASAAELLGGESR